MHFDFVFLQHGIIKDDLSKWLQKRNKKIDLFVTSALLQKMRQLGYSGKFLLHLLMQDYTVAAICAALDAECALQAPYTDRVAHFYAYHDDQNARRIYDAVRSDQAKK